MTDRQKDRQKEDRQKEDREQERKRRWKTPPCVDSKRFRVCVRDASVCTRKTPACVERAGVFPVHTEGAFRMPTQNDRDLETKK